MHEPQDVPVMPVVEEIEARSVDEVAIEADKAKGALRLVMIGVGQCGGNIADAFYAEGLRGVGVINSNPQDMAGLTVKHRLCLGGVDGGTGKDMDKGRAIVSAHRDEIIDFIGTVCGSRYHRLFLLSSTGGGTGAGSFEVMLDCAERAGRHLDHTGPMVGAILALPTVGGGYQARANTLRLLEFALRAVEDKRLSPLILVDNNRMLHMASPLTFHKTINMHIVRQIIRFNAAALAGSSYAQFDGGELLSIFDSGVVTMGITRVDDVSQDKAIGNAIREKFRNNIFLDTPLDNVTHAGCVFVGNFATLDGIKQAQIDDGLDSLNHIIAAKSVMHHGIYVDEREQKLVVTVMLGGLGAPAAYLESLRKTV